MEKQCLITENQFFYLLDNKAIEEIKSRLSDDEICLKEERGVGAAPYRKQINNICNYAAVYVYENKKPSIDLKFEVPLSLTKPISMFSELHLGHSFKYLLSILLQSLQIVLGIFHVR